jgi:hypothetical protein
MTETLGDGVFLTGLVPGLLVAIAQRGPAFRTLPFLACWLVADAACAVVVRLGVR